jgi:iron-sulfur cluster insertion protein
MNVIITDAARIKITDILYENKPGTHLRMFVQGGGCSGFSYGFALEDVVNDDDFEIPCEPASVLVDSASAQYLDGSTVDYSESLMESGFKINNPSAVSTCGCGSSFSV